MAPHSNTLAWKIPWMEESGRLQSMGFYSLPLVYKSDHITSHYIYSDTFVKGINQFITYVCIYMCVCVSFSITVNRRSINVKHRGIFEIRLW